MSFFYYVAAFIVALGPLVVIHELGHYWIARRCGVKVLRFSIGFGKPLKTWIRGVDRTEWVIAAVPLGGYVKMLDEREGPVNAEELARAFNRQSVWKRIAIVIAGPAANLLMAVVLYWILFIHGIPGLRPVIDSPEAGSVAAQSGLQRADVIQSVNGEPTPTWQEVRWELLKNAVRRSAVVLKVMTEGGDSVERNLDMSGLTSQDLDGDFVRTLGLLRFQPQGAPEVAAIRSGSPAERGGLMVGDEIIAINNIRIDGTEKATGIIRSYPDQVILVEIRRSGSASVLLSITPERIAVAEGRAAGRIGAELRPARRLTDKYRITVSYGPVDSFGKALVKTWDMSIFSLKMLGKMLIGDVSLKNLSGPITIADYAGQSAKLGWIPFLTFLAVISISLGVLNLLPIPLLDGGHLMYYIAEIFKGAPVSERAMEFGQRVGLGVLLLLMVFAIYNDVNRLISG